jgi:hypothetical protein
MYVPNDYLLIADLSVHYLSAGARAHFFVGGFQFVPNLVNLIEKNIFVCADISQIDLKRFLGAEPRCRDRLKNVVY